MMVRLLTGVLVASTLLLGLQTYRLALEQGSHSDTKAKHSQHIAELERKATEAVQAARIEEQRRTEEVQKASDEASEAMVRARADAVAALDTGKRLRQRIAALTAGCGKSTNNPGPTNGGAPAGSTADLLADVQRRLDAASEGIAEFADAARTAGVACQRSYESLKH